MTLTTSDTYQVTLPVGGTVITIVADQDEPKDPDPVIVVDYSNPVANDGSTYTGDPATATTITGLTGLTEQDSLTMDFKGSNSPVAHTFEFPTDLTTTDQVIAEIISQGANISGITLYDGSTVGDAVANLAFTVAAGDHNFITVTDTDGFPTSGTLVVSEITNTVQLRSGNGVSTSFFVSTSIASIVEITIDGVATTAFTFGDFGPDTITFDVAPASGTNNISITYLTGREFTYDEITTGGTVDGGNIAYHLDSAEVMVLL